MKRDDLTNRETTGLEVLEVGRIPVKAWTRGVPVEDQAREQLRNVASLPFVFKHVAVMPDVHPVPNDKIVITNRRGAYDVMRVLSAAPAPETTVYVRWLASNRL